MRLYDPWKEWLDRQRTASRSAVVLRAVIIVATLAMCGLGSWFMWLGVAGTFFAVVALLACGIWAAAQPDGMGGLATFVIFGMWWWFAGWEAPVWQAFVCGLVALAFHLACSWAATGPLHSDFAPSMRVWMGRTAVGLGVAGAAAMALAWGASLLPAAGPVVWSAVAVAAVVAMVVAFIVVRGGRTGW